MTFLTQDKTNWKYILIVLILAVIVGSGTLWFSTKKEQPYQSPEIKKAEKEFADWQIYRNKEYGFEISFPEDWFFRGGCPMWSEVPLMIDTITLNSPEWEKMRDAPIGGAYVEDIIITFEKITKYGVTTIDELIEKAEEDDPQLPFFTPFVPEGKTTIANREAYEIVVCGYGCEYTIFIEKDGYLYKIAFTKAWSDESDLSEVERQILSTFKFLD